MVFQMSFGNLINVIAIAIGTGICALNIFQISAGDWLRKEIKRYFQIFFSSVIVYILMHLVRQLLDGVSGSGVRIALYTTTFLEFLASGFMVYLISLLITFAADAKHKKGIGKVLLAVFILQCVLLIAAQFGKFYYDFDAQNTYHRSNLYLLSNLAHVVMMCIDIFILIRYRKNFKKRVAISLWVYLLAPLFAMLLQAFVADVQFIIIATIGGAAFMYTTIMQDQVEQYEQQKAESNRLETELGMASSIQADMLPNIFPAFPDRPEFDVYASMTPAKEVGGDFYDFFLIDETHLGIVMADVSGKGVPAALFMMVSKILVQNYAMITKSPAAALEAVNNQICLNNREEMFVTVWLGILDLQSGKLTSASAGHEYPAVYQPDGDFELVRDKHGLVIGAMEGIRYRDTEITLQPDAKLFLYTDGVPEATDVKNKQYGTDRMIQALREAQQKTPQEILTQVTESVKDFTRGADQFDDITMLCVHYDGPNQE
ncbi:MAG: serine/threonine-protein phosphatase [Clostridia bacterium]|nr:serine/threonine-protein phosphatase [Clostridia bacterium]